MASKFLEVRVRFHDSMPDKAITKLGERLQEMIPSEFETMPEYEEEFEDLSFEVEDVTYEIRKVTS